MKDNLRLQEITTCEDSEENIIGIKFSLRGENTSGRPPGQLVLDALGTLANCDSFRPETRFLDKIDVQWNKNDGVTGLRYYLGGRSRTYGKIE